MATACLTHEACACGSAAPRRCGCGLGAEQRRGSSVRWRGVGGSDVARDGLRVGMVGACAGAAAKRSARCRDVVSATCGRRATRAGGVTQRASTQRVLLLRCCGSAASCSGARAVVWLFTFTRARPCYGCLSRTSDAGAGCSDAGPLQTARQHGWPRACAAWLRAASNNNCDGHIQRVFTLCAALMAARRRGRAAGRRFISPRTRAPRAPRARGTWGTCGRRAAQRAA
jgi:hypothetical protein